ncbi:MAG: PHP domain-containing protein [Myxococcota bacterium]
MSRWKSKTGGSPGALRVDLHMHSSRSDGRLSPGAVLAQCARGGLDVIALTDHDLPPVLDAGPQHVNGRDVHVIHGVELSTMHEGSEQHLLVYFPGTIPEDFAAFCRGLVIARADRYDEAVRRINLPGLALADDDARQGRRSVTRTHLSQALVAAGHAQNLEDAFSRWTGERAGLVPAVGVSFLDALQKAKTAGGLTSWAHPSRKKAEAWVAGFAAAGLDALEVYRPSFNRDKRDALTRLAWRNGLQVTGGSDYHGWRPGQLGAFSATDRQLRPIIQRLGLSAAGAPAA